MNTLIAYAGKYGGTRSCAEKIKARLPGTVTLFDLEDGTAPDLSGYDTVIIGCSVYMGKPRKAVVRFCRAQSGALMEKDVGLFLCCIQDIEKSLMQQYALAFPKALLAHAKVHGQLGGVVDFTKLTPVDRFIMNLVAGDLRKKTGGDVISTLSDERIDRFVELLQAPKNKDGKGDRMP